MNKQDYLLVCLMEELAEAQQACAKALRFGLDDHHPQTQLSNEDSLWNEINDVYAILDLLKEQNVSVDRNETRVKVKKEKVLHYMGYSVQKGKLD